VQVQLLQAGVLTVNEVRACGAGTTGQDGRCSYRAKGQKRKASFQLLAPSF